MKYQFVKTDLRVAPFALTKSESLFMKERFTLFKSGLCSFLKRKLSHFLALLLQKPKESTSPFLKRAIHSRRSLQQEQKEQLDRSFLSKNKRFAQKTKERMPNPASMKCVKNYTAGVG